MNINQLIVAFLKSSEASTDHYTSKFNDVFLTKSKKVSG